MAVHLRGITYDGRLRGLWPLGYVAVATNILVGDRLVPTPVSEHDVQRALQVAWLVVIALIVVVRRREIVQTWGRYPRWARRATGFLIVLGTLSAMTAPFPKAAAREVGLFTLLGLSSVVVADGRRRAGEDFDRAALTLLFACAAIYVVAFFALDALGVAGVGGVRSSSMWGFSNPRFFGQVGLWIFPLLVSGCVSQLIPLRSRLIFALVATVWGSLVLESGSRAALAGLLGATLLIGVLERGDAWRWLAAVIPVAMGSWVAWRSLLGPSGVFSGSAPTENASGISRLASESLPETDRFTFWSDALELLRADVVLGAGPEHYAHTPSTLYGHPHNAIIQLAAEWGAPAAAIVLTLALWGAWRWFTVRGTRASQPPGVSDVAVGLGAALVAGGIASSADGIIVTPISQVLLAVIVGWMSGVYYENPGAAVTQGPSTRSEGRLIQALALAAVVALVVGALPYALRPSREVSEFTQSNPDQHLAPRFWLVGRLAPADWARVGAEPRRPDPVGSIQPDP